MKLIFIYGPPAVGKYTVAMELGRLTGFKVFHNHMSTEAVSPVFPLGSPSYSKLVIDFRSAVLEEASRTDTDLIFTFVYGHPMDKPYVDRLCSGVEWRHGTVCFVQLVADKALIEQRAPAPHRVSMGKLHTPESVRDLMERWDTFTPIPGRESLMIDTGKVTAAEAARKIAEHYGLPSK